MLKTYKVPVLFFIILAVIIKTCSSDSDQINNEVCEKGEEDCNAEPQKKPSSRELHNELKETLKGIRKSCGDLCSTDIKGTEGKYYDVIKKDFDCDALFENLDIDRPSKFYSPPAKIPKHLLADFTYGGRVDVKYVVYVNSS